MVASLSVRCGNESGKAYEESVSFYLIFVPRRRAKDFPGMARRPFRLLGGRDLIKPYRQSTPGNR